MEKTKVILIFLRYIFISAVIGWAFFGFFSKMRILGIVIGIIIGAVVAWQEVKEG